jgi:hypothetical protein
VVGEPSRAKIETVRRSISRDEMERQAKEKKKFDEEKKMLIVVGSVILLILSLFVSLSRVDG